MKKKMGALILGMILTTGMILSGCGSKANTSSAAQGAAAGAEENALPGSYYAVYDATDTMKEAMGDMVKDLSTPIEMVFLLDLNEDDTFQFAVDGESFVTSVTSAFQGSIDGIIAAAMGVEELDEETKELLATESGHATYEEFCQAMLDSMTEEMKSQDLEEMKLGGKYTVNGNTIAFAPEDEQGELPDTTIEEDGTLTMTLDNEMVNGTLVFEKGSYTAEEAA